MSISGARKLTINDFTSSQSWTIFDKYFRRLVDVNGDNRADIICFMHESVVASLRQSKVTLLIMTINILLVVDATSI